MKTNKNTYKLKSNDQMDIFYRALFMGVMQFTFIFTLLMNETFDLTYKNDTAVNFCQFFCVMILHWQCLPDVRNGIYMMKYALCCPEEFNQPMTAFLLGFIQFTAIVSTEICNLMRAYQNKKVQDVVVKFAAFATLVAVPKLLHASMETFDIQKCVGKLSLRKGRKAVQA